MITALRGFSAGSMTEELRHWWRTIDRPVLMGAGLLMLIGLILSLATSPVAADRIALTDSYYFTIRQAGFVIIACGVLVGASLLSPRDVRRGAILLYLLAVVAMALVLLLGHEAKGAQRWIRVAGFSFQPSELVKPAMIVLAAWLFARRGQDPKFPAIAIALVLFAIPAFLLIRQPDVGQTGLLTLAFLIVFFVAGLSWWWILGFMGAALVGAATLYQTLPHVTERVDGFLKPGATDSYQIERALDAIASGDVFGRGIGEGEIKALLPDAHTDFVFAVASEEWGLLGAALLIFLFALIVVRGLAAARRQDDAFAQYAATGLYVLFGCQVAINLAVNLHLMPPKGMTLPFLSYGGSSLLGAAVTLGLALALTRRRPVVPAG